MLDEGRPFETEGRKTIPQTGQGQEVLETEKGEDRRLLGLCRQGHDACVSVVYAIVVEGRRFVNDT